MPKKISLIGLRFARLKVIGKEPPKVYPSGRKLARYRCVCDCGTIVIKVGQELTAGGSTSCGCLTSELRSANAFKHGYGSRKERKSIYSRWANMVKRCLNPKDQAWHNYGGRGITVCKRWLDFKNFLEDMGEPPPGMTLERKNNQGNYEPSNCTWATRSEQGKNTRRTRIFTVLGITGCALDLARHFGLDRRIPMERIDRYGWNPHDAFTKPSRIRKKHQSPTK